MEEKLAMFDIDGTVDGLPAGNLLPVLDEYRDQGFVFGINTNRPFGEAVSFYDSLEMRGPFIVENGASFRKNRQSAPETYSNEMVEVNGLIHEILSKSGPEVRVTMSCDKSSLNNPENGLAALITESRRYTSSVYVRLNGRISREVTERVVGMIREGLGELINGVGLSIDGSGGKILVWNTLVDRLGTLFRIWQTQYNTYDVLVVSDYEPGSESDLPFVFASVLGADSDYVKRCQIRASIGGVDGICQILEQFSKR